MAHAKLDVVLVQQSITVEIAFPSVVIHTDHRHIQRGIGHVLLANDRNRWNAFSINDVIPDICTFETIPRPRSVRRSDDLVALRRMRIEVTGCAIVADIDTFRTAGGDRSSQGHDGSSGQMVQFHSIVLRGISRKWCGRAYEWEW
ncbi:hypothetical protein FQK02_17980 [Xanthomonas vasicola]|uniref:Uncharacterized protein n=1 Tax=Xanthomonas vasicola pv. vasculorum NCPPB 890 TaxID=1184265 RepID=A0A837B5V3_XANVA|nr:hypothetical protein KW5_0104745 [Xanthomonas vasicola pv. vasculorum NCPPB 1326]KFA30585.1 hypothetical protein KWG_0112760 [Xanthomonas vasicola pv. vasculorum NCPPB 1381]TWQ10392.1 hypothetical protein FQK02_17980 [Xanthomonas vasicola]